MDFKKWLEGLTIPIKPPKDTDSILRVNRYQDKNNNYELPMGMRQYPPTDAYPRLTKKRMKKR